MAEIRINATGGLKLYDADNSHYAQILAGTITSAGVMTNTAPTSTDDVVQIIGHSVGEKLVFVQPSLTFITHE
mgnify:CR=1 FL=1